MSFRSVVLFSALFALVFLILVKGQPRASNQGKYQYYYDCDCYPRNYDCSLDYKEEIERNTWPPECRPNEKECCTPPPKYWAFYDMENWEW
ncbi:hypothetical protein KUTeg_001795 [Tegillarca granosa]|uniref:Uncharacterized protein n=1 Tax=Tegillarca granosa TaxID=220873 RepID=A0ABQ9FSH3_TEGGR|nr:hypothetical protein KUTeg_001795 [Tegillarca granosa]